MDKNEKLFTTEQGDLFLQLESVTPDYLSDNAPDLDIEAEFMGAVKYAIRVSKKHGLSIERIAERMNLCLPEELHVTSRKLYAWCAQSQEYKLFPAIYLPAFIWATHGIVHPLEIITRSLGLHLVDEKEVLAAELGKTAVAKAENSRKERELKMRLHRY